jgi:hypothetical protein
MAQRRVTDQALPDGVYPYTVASGQARYYAKLASGATKRGFTSARAASRFKKSADSAPAQPKQTRDSFAALWPGFLRVRRPYLVPGTYDDYARHGRLRLIPRFGPDKVAAITKADVQDWLADLDEAEELAPKTINNALRVLQAFFTGWSTIASCCCAARRGRSSRSPRTSSSPTGCAPRRSRCT